MRLPMTVGRSDPNRGAEVVSIAYQHPASSSEPKKKTRLLFHPHQVKLLQGMGRRGEKIIYNWRRKTFLCQWGKINFRVSKSLNLIWAWEGLCPCPWDGACEISFISQVQVAVIVVIVGEWWVDSTHGRTTMRERRWLGEKFPSEFAIARMANNSS